MRGEGCNWVLRLTQFFLLWRGRYVVQYLVYLGTVDTDVLCRAKIANLRIKVVGMNVIG